MMVAVHNKELTAHIGKMNMAHFDRITFFSRQPIILGLIDGEQPHSKPRRAGRTVIIEE